MAKQKVRYFLLWPTSKKNYVLLISYYKGHWHKERRGIEKYLNSLTLSDWPRPTCARIPFFLKKEGILELVYLGGSTTPAKQVAELSDYYNIVEIKSQRKLEKYKVLLAL